MKKFKYRVASYLRLFYPRTYPTSQGFDEWDAAYSRGVSFLSTLTRIR